jgi:hypothetical protein
MKLYTEEQVKLIATRFARQSRFNEDVTSNDTITSFEKFIVGFDPGATTDDILIRVNERERAMNICLSFMDDYNKSYDSRTKAEAQVYKGKPHQSVVWVDKERSEVARYCCNAISGRTGLNADEPLENIIKRT